MPYQSNNDFKIGKMLKTGSLDGLPSGDFIERFNVYAIGVQNGFLTVDEVRELEGLPPLKEPSPPESGDE